MLDLHQLRTFCAVARLQNFTRAADELGYSQSTVTIQIKLLERELGADLFVRTRFSKTVLLTDAGRHMVSFADRLLTLAAEAKAVARAGRRDALPLSSVKTSGTITNWPKVRGTPSLRPI